jgi:hypothetical protein
MFRQAHPVAKDKTMSHISFAFLLTIAAITTFVVARVVQPVMAQAPINDLVGRHSGLLLLASVLYAALAQPPDILWTIDPAIGVFMGSGLPHVSIPAMQRVNWVANACHFVPKIRSAYGISNFWIRSENVSRSARTEAIGKALQVLSPVECEPSEYMMTHLCNVAAAGLLESFSLASLSPPIMSLPAASTPSLIPTPRDFLLFAAIHYHTFWEWEVQVEQNGQLVFSTRGTDARAIFDVQSKGMALPVWSLEWLVAPIRRVPSVA